MFRVLTHCWRLCSSNSSTHRFSEEEIQAILELKRKGAKIIRKNAENVLKNREWARAPMLEVSGRKHLSSWHLVDKKKMKLAEDGYKEQSVVKLRWANQVERDVDIILSSDDTMYTVEVKAVLYGIIQAIDLKERRVRIQSPNDIVVKVANKLYNASKEAARFQLISKVINGNEMKIRESQLKVKLKKACEPKKPIRGKATTVMAEKEFFEKYRDSIETLKSYE